MFTFYRLLLCSSIHIWQTFNALFIVRCTVKYLIETGSEYQLLQHFEAMPTGTDAATAAATTTGTTAETANGGGAVAVNIDNDTESKSKLIRPVDGSKFETFFDAIVNLLIIIPVK